MKFLLPHRYKKLGALLTPLGFILWSLMQLGYIKKLLLFLFGETSLNYVGSPYHTVNVIAAILGFFSFLGGIYFLTFSKEKVEDEMVQRTRLDSFQFAAFMQIISIICGFLFILLAGDLGESGMMLFFIILVLLFWLSFIGRFNYTLHVKYRQ
jgi:hypothetical protein